MCSGLLLHLDLIFGGLFETTAVSKEILMGSLIYPERLPLSGLGPGRMAVDSVDLGR